MSPKGPTDGGPRRAETAGDDASGRGRARVFLRTAFRVAVGGLFVFSGLTKLRDPQLFAFALKSLRLGFGDAEISFLARAVPWWETLAGGMLAAGVWVREAAWVAAGLLIVFSSIIASLMLRGVAVDCPCFGAFELLCSGPLGLCHVVRNAFFLAAVAAAATVRRAPA